MMDSSGTIGFLDMLFGSGPVVQSVLYLLIILSVFSWAITIAKTLEFQRARKDSRAFSKLFWEAKNLARVDDSARRLGASPLAQIFSAGYREVVRALHDAKEEEVKPDSEIELENVRRVLARAELEQGVRLERGTTFLATVASAAPFIGLFGTVWGIMTAFNALGTARTTSIQAVAPGISEALVATAVGLAAAIPAAVAYNYFATGVRHFRESMGRFRAEFVNVARQYFE